MDLVELTKEEARTIKTIKQSDLTSECWLVQMWGLAKCEKCEFLNTSECGGVRIRQAILDGNYPRDGLPNQTRKEMAK